MNVLILGDSWGFSYPENIDETSHSLENTLFLSGHTVFNKAIYGGSNLHTLNLGLTFLNCTQHLFKIDLIVWFSTELGRDSSIINLETIKNYKDFLDKIHEKTLSKVLELKSISPDTKWAIIGGHTALYNELDYQWADFLLPDWKSEILGIAMPKCQYMGDFDNYLYNNRDKFGFDFIENEIINYEKILNIQNKNKNIFFDGVHVNNDCNSNLALRLLNWISNT